MPQRATTTPILDLELAVPGVQQRWTPVTNMTFWSMLFGLGFWAVLFLNRFVFWSHPLRTLITLLVTHCVTCVIHECGHATAAILVGHRLISFRAGSLSVVRRNGDFRVSFNWKNVLAGGAVIAVPPLASTRRWRLIVVLACGPLTQFLLLLSIVAGWRFWLQEAPTLCLPAFWVSLTFLVGALIPREMGATVSDGGRLLQLLRTCQAPALCAAVELFGRAIRGQLRANKDPRLADLAATCGPYAVDRHAGRMLAYQWAFACDDRDRAAAYLESALAACGDMSIAARAGLFQTAAMFQFVRHNAAAARVWLTRAKEEAASTEAAPSVLLSLQDRRGSPTRTA